LFVVFCAGECGKSMGVSPVWGREMNRKEEAEALLVEILQRGFSA
jgi:hypothetical protein